MAPDQCALSAAGCHRRLRLGRYELHRGFERAGDELDFRVGERGPLAFLFLTASGMAFYVLALRGFLLGYHGAPVIAAQQAIELLIKVVVQQHDR